MIWCREYDLDFIALRCWEEMQTEADIAVAPCVLMGELTTGESPPPVNLISPME